MTATARKAELDAESREVLDEIVAGRRAEREQLAAITRAKQAAEKAEAERVKLNKQRARDAAEGLLDAISDAQIGFKDGIQAFQRAMKFGAVLAEARAQLGFPMPGLYKHAALMRWSCYLAELLSQVSGSNAFFGKLEIKNTGKRHGDWVDAERRAVNIHKEDS